MLSKQENPKCRHDRHVQTVEGHPGGSVGLTKDSSGGKGFRTIEGTDIIQTEEATFKDIVSTLVLPVYPPN